MGLRTQVVITAKFYNCHVIKITNKQAEALMHKAAKLKKREKRG